MNKKKLLSPTKKGQAVTIDFITGLIIITIALITAVNLIENLQQPNTFEDVKRRAIAASEVLMSEGYPTNWNQTTVIKLGLLNENQINKTKIQELEKLTYDEIKITLNGVGNIYWYFTNKTTIINLSSCGYGDVNITTNPITCEPNIPTSKNFVSIDRFVTYNNTILRLVIFAWD